MARKGKEKRYKESRNTRASHEYFIEDTVEAGIVLTGTEVKSIRQSPAQINDAFVRFEAKGPMLYHAHITEYTFGNYANHKPTRPRKLLLHSRQILKWSQAVQTTGQTVIPLRMYFKKGLIKVEIALVRGKKQYDKREDIKRKEDLRETQRALKEHLS
jgi:SsrA-binding protein